MKTISYLFHRQSTLRLAKGKSKAVLKTTQRHSITKKDTILEKFFLPAHTEKLRGFSID